MKALTEEGVKELVARSSKVLFPILLPIEPEEDDEEAYNMVICYPLFVRSGGFMLVMPKSQEAQNAVDVLDFGPEEIVPTFHEGIVVLETPQRKRLSTVDALLVDLPWSVVGQFSPSSALRGQGGVGVRSIQFRVDGVLGRPTKASAEALGSTWISSVMDEDTAQEYATGEEVAPGEEELMTEQPNGGVSSDVVQALQQRIQELEEQVQRAQQPVPMMVPPTSKAPPLLALPTPGGQTQEVDWQKLQRLAGAPPPRIGKAETRRQPFPKGAAQDNMFAEMEKEVEEAALGEAALEELGQDSSTLSRVMVNQLKQNQLLLQKLLGPRFQDPVMGALAGGSGSDSGGGNSGVKGCLAREAFVRTMLDLPRVAAVTQANAAKELGLTEDRIDGNLMKKYIERRIPIGDNKMVGYLAFMMGEAWLLGWESENTQLLGIISKVMYFLEQTSLDGGKMQLSWLLTGHAEPPFNIYNSNRRRVGLQPFCRLCAPSWVAANLSYVRDLDVLESKMLQMGKPSKTVTQNEDAEEDKPPKAPKRKPPKGKGKKGSELDEASASWAVHAVPSCLAISVALGWLCVPRILVRLMSFPSL